MTVRIPIIFNPATGRLEELGLADSIAGTEIEGLMGRNRFINGDMRIWQRGVSFSASGAVGKVFCADRWFVERSTSTMAVARQDTTVSDRAIIGPVANYMRVSVAASAGAGHYALLAQDVEDVLTFAGQTVVVSGWFRAQSSMNISLEAIQVTNGGSGNPSFSSASQRVTTSWQYLSFVVPIAAFNQAIIPGSRLRLRFWMSGGSDWASSTNVGTQNGYFDYALVQTEQGVVASPFERRLDAIEMLMCQRFYEKTLDVDVLPTTSNYFGRVAFGSPVIGGNMTFLSVPFKVTKRGAPAVTVWSATPTPAAGFVGQDDGSTVPVSVQNVGSNGAQISWSNTPGRWGGFFQMTSDAEF
ncbi:hypothetical protein [Stenotrophomonas maltophilia]|uniref:hypothetical protein n=1 Tax=Stenotrophomonas maltophilia TaxID=40324 RepID=UPI0015DE3760|nr:hypothetical protein [Stenotrophomonas maltophilia]MBA0361080.1 hypothetical protein [Stenotrophomonas maltophilia]HEL5042991.1 hypothetical protein [Stenotrophomonas maltophilia]